MIKVAIVEDDQHFLKLLCKLLTRYGFEVVATFPCSTPFVDYIQEIDNYPDICIFDLELPDFSGVELVNRIRNFLEYTNVLILTSFKNEDMVFEALKMGASGYILKTELTKKLKSSIEEVQNGGIVIEPILANRFLNYFRSFQTPVKEDVGLNQTQEEMLFYLVKGFTYKEIAGLVDRTPRNVKYVLSQIYKKLNVKSRVEAVKAAIQKGIVEI